MQQSRWQKHEYFARFLDLLFRPTSRAKIHELVTVHHIHHNSVAILSKVIHDRCHIKLESLVFWVVARVEEFTPY